MKYILPLFLLLLSVNFAYSAFEEPHITVIGFAETEVVPDEIRWNLGIKTEGSTTIEVSKRHTTEVSQVLQVLRRLGQKEDSVLTTNMQLKENWVNRNNNKEQNGYYGFTEVHFKTNDFSTYVDYWSGLTVLPHVSVSSVTFGLSSRTQIEDQMEIKAVKVGREKAVALAAALGAEIGNPLLIEEVDGGTYFPQPVARTMAIESDGGGKNVISPGKEVVSPDFSSIKFFAGRGHKSRPA